MLNTILAHKEEISYEMLTKNDLAQTILCVAETFSNDEPMTRAACISRDEFYPFAKSYCEKAVSDEISVIARDNETRQVIGFMISEELASDMPQGLHLVSEKFYPIMALLNELDEKYRNNTPCDQRKVLRLFMCGVNQYFSGRHILTNLVAEALKIGQMKGFTSAISETTGPVSEHVLVDKYDFKHRFKIYYQSFAYQGKNHFESIEAADYCTLVEKQLS